MGEPMTLFGGPSDGVTINFRGGWKLTILSNIDHLGNWRGEFLFDDYVRLGPDLKVLAWMGASNVQ